MAGLWVMSDLHLEAVRQPDAYRPRCAGFDVLVVAGDVQHGAAQAVATIARLGRPLRGSRHRTDVGFTLRT